MKSETGVALCTLITAIVGLAFVYRQLNAQRRAMKADFGNLYIQRYWTIDDDLLMTKKGTEAHDRHRHRYVRLFEDEFDVAALGFLDGRQWEVWHSVLDDPRHQLRVQDDLAVSDRHGDQFVRLRGCIRQRVREGKSHSVKDCAAQGAQPPKLTPPEPEPEPEPERYRSEPA